MGRVGWVGEVEVESDGGKDGEERRRGCGSGWELMRSMAVGGAS